MSYQGRKIMIGWGSNRALASIDQLKEAAATIIRLSSDPSSAFSAEFQEREVDNHVLRELDPLTHLPMHLSLVTAVTINLGRLEEQVIERDVDRLVNSLVFDKSNAGIQDNILLGKFADALSGENAEDRYQKLLAHLSEGVGLSTMQKRLDTTVTSKGIPGGEKGSKLAGQWQEYKQELRQSRHRIHDVGRNFIAAALPELERIKGERICRGGISLTELREEYRSLQTLLASTLQVARDSARTSVSDSLVENRQRMLGGIWPFSLFNRNTKLRQLSTSMKRNLQDYLQESARSSAIDVLEKLEQHCAEIGRNLDIVLNKLRRQRDNKLKNIKSERDFSVDTGNPLNLVALPSVDEMNNYASQVSLFNDSNTQGVDQLAEFRQWLQNGSDINALFKGDLDELMKVIAGYAKEKVHAAIEEHSVLDILRQAGEDSLRRRLFEASAKAAALVSYSEDFALERREAWHVSAYYKNEEQRDELQSAIDEAFAQGQCKLLSSNDPAEIAIFYYVDGIPMSAVDDLKGRCLNAFLKRRQQWHKQKAMLNGNNPTSSIGSFNQRVGVPIYSGLDAETRVMETCVISRLYTVKGQEVGIYKAEDVPELECSLVSTQQTPSVNHTLNGNSNGSGTVTPDLNGSGVSGNHGTGDTVAVAENNNN
jgi:hypothetical protein